jgi:predicted nucleic acid-binding protein
MTVFADTFYFLALLSSRDSAHSRAVQYTHSFTGQIITTAWVLTEVADGMTTIAEKERFIAFFDRLSTNADITIVPNSQALFDQGMELYRQRLDKEWSLTDCISFVVMEQQRVREVLTGDHHFEQAGFVALLKP